jgi:hypothetical protein
MPASQYEPNSVNATLGAILTELKGTKETLNKVLEQTTKTNGRVTALERWQSYVMGAAIIIALFINKILPYLF